MKSIPRRLFFKQAGHATAFGYLGTNLTADSGRIAIADPVDGCLGPDVKSTSQGLCPLIGSKRKS
jgi:hypothetical protein